MHAKSRACLVNTKNVSSTDELSGLVILKGFYWKLLMTYACIPIRPDHFKELVKRKLTKHLSVYNEELDGIILQMHNIKVYKPSEASRCPKIPVDCYLDIYLFRTSIGDNLTGVVTKKGEDFVSCTLYGMFNIAVLKPDDESTEMWNEKSIEIFDKITFQVLKLDIKTKVPFIVAKILNVLTPDN